MPRNRSLPPHLEYRSTGYFWRRRWPRNALFCSNDAPSTNVACVLALRTHVLRDAKILARRLTGLSDQIFAAIAEKTMTIAPDLATRLLEQLARFEIDAYERTRAIADPRSFEAASFELRREEALQDTLRRAILLGDREIARAPLRHVAACLGVTLHEAEDDWKALAYEATKVLLDVSLERHRRQQGQYGQPTVFFRRATATSATGAAAAASGRLGAIVEPAAFACLGAQPLPAPASATFVAAQVLDGPIGATVAPAASTCLGARPVPAPATAAIVTAQAATCAPPTLAAGSGEAEATPAGQPAAAIDLASPPLHAAAAGTQIVVPAGFDLPEGYDEESWQKARIAARPPRILVDRKLLSEGSCAALAKQRGITLVEAIELYFELVSWGYRAPFNAHQKRKAIPEKLKTGSVEERLCEDHRGKRRLALDYWPAALGDEPVDEIHVDDVNDALERFWRVPANHGKSEKDRGRFSLIELIEKADARAAQLDRDLAAAQARGAGSEAIDRMRLEGHEARISVTTYIKHGRVMRAVGEMLVDMQLIDQNPFSICSWSNKEEKALKSTEGDRKRQAWDDRIDDLHGSRIFQEPLEDVGEPLFWAPLIARHEGMRMEEILQLGPKDFGCDKGIPTITIRHTIINGVKTLSSARTLPVHPQLIELGLLKLVALRRDQGHIRLFPFLNRGKAKDTFAANFSKCFGYYRRTNACYWHGLDFHALRTTFHHDLLGDDKSDAIRCRLMGHSYTDEGDRSYGQNLGIEKLANRMKSVVVDISMIRSPFADPAVLAVERASTRGLRLVG